MPVRQVLNGRVPIKVWTADLEDSARRQLLQTGELPFVYHHVAASAEGVAGFARVCYEQFGIPEQSGNVRHGSRS